MDATRGDDEAKRFEPVAGNAEIGGRQDQMIQRAGFAGSCVHRAGLPENAKRGKA
jgi:hypothetical protein